MDATKNLEKRALIVESNDQSREFQSQEKMVRRVFANLVSVKRTKNQDSMRYSYIHLMFCLFAHSLRMHS